MRLGIITIIDNRNLGNRLQNYAVQKTLERICDGASVETVRNSNKKGRNETIINRFKLFLVDLKYNARTKNFSRFNKNICFSNKSYDSDNKNNELKDKYDYFLVGSDQVWNPNYGWLNSIDLLSFADSNQRVSFSASFGIDAVPENYKSEVAKQLTSFKCLSVREEKGKEIIEELTGRKDVTVLVDPTMLLDADEWKKLSKRPKWIRENEKFILCYFLGGLSKNRQAVIKEMAEKRGCRVINILDKKSKYYSCGPSEFLWLEANADLVCTDSFHSSVFSIINEKPFVVFDREGKHERMNSRLDTLLSTFNLQKCWYNEKTITKDSLAINYNEVKEIIKNERKKAVVFLETALKN